MADEIIDLTPRLKMRLAWDLIEHDEILEWLPKLGLVPPSAEGLEMDHIACHQRAARVRPIVPLLSAYASMVSQIHSAYVMEEAAELLSEEDREETSEMYGEVAFRMMQSAVVATVVELMQDGILAYGPAVDR